MHCTRLILDEIIKIKDYLISINNPVKTNKNARKYSVIFFVFSLLINILKQLQNNAQKHILGKHMAAAVKGTNTIPIKIFSWGGKNPDATAIAIDHALGLIN